MKGRCYDARHETPCPQPCIACAEECEPPACSGGCGRTQSDGGHPLSNLSDGTLICVSCWNRSVEEHRAQRKAELAARPKCESCGKRAGTWYVGYERALMCGRCKKARIEAAQAAAARNPLGAIAGWMS